MKNKILILNRKFYFNFKQKTLFLLLEKKYRYLFIIFNLFIIYKFKFFPMKLGLQRLTHSRLRRHLSPDPHLLWYHVVILLPGQPFERST